MSKTYQNPLTLLLYLFLSLIFFTNCVTGEEERKQESLTHEELGQEEGEELEQEEDEELGQEEDEELGQEEDEELGQEEESKELGQGETSTSQKTEMTALTPAPATLPAKTLSTSPVKEKSLPTPKISKHKVKESIPESLKKFPFFSYKVVKDDWLSKVSQQVYGDAHVWSRIYDMNRNKVSHPDRIKIGEKLKIPIVDAKSRSFAKNYQAKLEYEQKSKQKKTQTIAIKIKKGETLSSLAEKHLGSASKWQQIWELNKDSVKDPSKIFAGSMLKVNIQQL